MPEDQLKLVINKYQQLLADAQLESAMLAARLQMAEQELARATAPAETEGAEA